MRVAFIAVPVAIAALLAACSSTPKPCVPGASVACTCANGESGAQVCSSDRTLGACACQGGPGGTGSGGRSGAGGMMGSGGGPGAGGTMGSGGSPGTGGQMTTGQFTVTYDGSLTKTLSTCYSCLAGYSAPTRTSGVGYSFTVDAGITTVSMTIRPASSGGNEISIFLSESNQAVPANLQGTYVTSPQFVAVGSSCATFTTLTVGQGGTAAGSLNCTLSGGNDTTPHTAVLRGTFTATFL